MVQPVIAGHPSDYQHLTKSIATSCSWDCRQRLGQLYPEGKDCHQLLPWATCCYSYHWSSIPGWHRQWEYLNHQVGWCRYAFYWSLYSYITLCGTVGFGLGLPAFHIIHLRQLSGKGHKSYYLLSIVCIIHFVISQQNIKTNELLTKVVRKSDLLAVWQGEELWTCGW